MVTVYDYCELFSECAVSMVLIISYNSSRTINTKCRKEKLWDEEKRSIFINNLDDSMINSVLSKINEMENSQDISQPDLNCVAESLEDVYNLSSETSFGSVKRHSQPSENKPPHWFNRKCKVPRNDFHRAKYLYKIRQTDANKQRLKTCSKRK